MGRGRRFGKCSGVLVTVAVLAGSVAAAVTAVPAAAVVPNTVNQMFVAGASTPFGVVVDGNSIYWTNTGTNTIGRANLDGTGVDQSFITGASEPSGLVVNAGFIYWANQFADSIGRANLDGTGATQSFITLSSGPVGLAVDSQYIYWTSGYGDTIGRANLAGTGVNESFITGTPNATSGLAVDAGHIYWANQFAGTISRANLDGTGVTASFITSTSQIAGLIVDANYIYWANDTGNAIGRANVADGSGVDQSFVGATAPVGVWVDANYLYWSNSGANTIGRAHILDVPDAPTIGSATAGNGSATVTFTPPADDGGSTILHFDATCTSSSGSETGSGASSPVLVTGLTNGDTYTCTVTATNTVGPSLPSAPSNPFVPVTAPAPPTITSVFDGSASSASPTAVGVSFTPGTDGGSPITSYAATCVGLDDGPTGPAAGPTGSASGTGSPIFVGGLAAVGGYQCTVTASNAFGTSAPSAPFIVFLGGSGNCPELPTAPAALSTGPGNNSATVSWAPATGNCIAGYVVTPYVGGVAQLSKLIPGHGTTTVMKGLTNGVSYTFTVAAENGAALGPPSVMTGAITAGTPAAVTGLHVTRIAKGTLKVAFAVPANNGAPITSYAATCTSKNRGAPKGKIAKSGPLTVNGLTGGKTYSCTVTASNARGAGPTSHASAPVNA